MGVHDERIASEFRDAVWKGVRSTPTFLVNGRPVIGAQSFDSWKLILDGALAQR
jgi:protein-disulfide isomerase